MYCPQCGTESSAGLQYCRSCGANLKVIGKAVSLSEAIARSDRGPLPKIKEMMKGLADKTKFEKVTEDIENALEQMNKEIVKSSEDRHLIRPWGFGKRRTSEERREDHLTKGTISVFSGSALTIFLYFLSSALVLKLPPEFVAKVPFEIESVVPVLWLLGLIPVMSGVGHIIAGLLIRPKPVELQASKATGQLIQESAPSYSAPRSVTERTTNILERKIGK